MRFSVNGFHFHITKNRTVKTDSTIEHSYAFTSEAECLLIEAINAAIKSSMEEGGVSKIVPLQGLVDLTENLIHIGSLGSVRHDRECVDERMLCFTSSPMFEHKKPGLFEMGLFSPRIESYQKRYSIGPTAHQQLLYHAVKKPQVSADDAEDKRGFAFSIQIIDKLVSFVIDGNSLSINETAQYLRTMHPPKHELSAEEAKNEVLKASKEYSAACEDWILENIAKACLSVILRQDGKLYSWSTSPSIASSSSPSHLTG